MLEVDEDLDMVRGVGVWFMRLQDEFRETVDEKTDRGERSRTIIIVVSLVYSLALSGEEGAS